MHTTYEDCSLEELEEIEIGETHKKGFLALESLKEKDPERYEKQKKYLENNETQFWEVYGEKTRVILPLPPNLDDELFELHNKCVKNGNLNNKLFEIFKKKVNLYKSRYDVFEYRRAVDLCGVLSD